MSHSLDAKWEREPPATDADVQAFAVASGLALPEEYLGLLRFSNGGEGRLGVRPGWFQIWPVHEVIELNVAYQIPKFLPGFFAFGSSGGGDMLAFDTRAPVPWKIYCVPFIGMEEENALLVANGFADFIRAMGQDEKVSRISKTRLAQECAKLEPAEEQAMAEEGLAAAE